MVDSFVPSNNENFFQSLNPEEIVLPSPAFSNLLNPGFGEELRAFDHSVANLAGDSLEEWSLDLEATEIDSHLVDRLTGEALQNFAADPHFTDKMSLAFGDNWNRETVRELQQDWLRNDFSDIPDVQILSSDVLSSANGAYSSEMNTIYLSRDFLTENAANPAAVADVLLEEYGHAIDAKINAVDSDGDEGEIFASVVQGEALSEGELLALKVEDDAGMITLDGEEIPIEMRLFNLGTYRTRSSSGTVNTSNPSDSYRFSINSRQQVNISLAELQADADIELVQSQGPINISLASSRNGGTRGEFISQILNPGTYMVNVSRYGNANTNYQLFLQSGWDTEYFNNVNLTGSPVSRESIDSVNRNSGQAFSFSRNWGNSSPFNTPSDNFSGRMTTRRYLEPGLYRITTQADDGVRVFVSNQRVIDRWVDQPFMTNSGYFRSNGGNESIEVNYFERGGGAALNFDIQRVQPFQDAVNESQQWKASIFNWDPRLGPQPSVNFFAGDLSNPNAIGVINLGSNTRGDGKKGISFDLGNGTFNNNDGSRLPHDNFAVRAYTQADFDGGKYKFRARGDDGFQILAKQHGTNQWFYITPQPNSWDQAYGAHKEYEYTLPAGRYDVHFHQFEASGNAYLDLSWEKVGGNSSGGGVSGGVVRDPNLTPVSGSLLNNPDSFFGWAKGRTGIDRLDTYDYRGQCVSLVARYIQEVFLPSNQRTIRQSFNNGELTASTVASKFSQYFEPLTTSGLPERGSIISFDGPGSDAYGNPYVGHVGIVLEARYNNGQREVKILESNADGKAEKSTVTESNWINIENYPGSIVAGTTGWTNPR